MGQGHASGTWRSKIPTQGVRPWSPPSNILLIVFSLVYVCVNVGVILYCSPTYVSEVRPISEPGTLPLR